jgi:hypothetical protein
VVPNPPRSLLVEPTTFGRHRDAIWLARSRDGTPGAVAAGRFQHLVACELRALVARNDGEPLTAVGVNDRTVELASLLGMSTHTLRRKMRGEHPLKMEELGSMLVALGAGALPDITAEVLPPAWRFDDWDGKPIGVLRSSVPNILASSARSQLVAFAEDRLILGEAVDVAHDHESAVVVLEVLDAPGCAGRADLDQVISSIRSRMDAKFRQSASRPSVVMWEPTT